MTGNTPQFLYPSLSRGFLVLKFSHSSSKKTSVMTPMPGLAQVITARGIFIPAFAKSSSSSLQVSFSSLTQEVIHLLLRDLKLDEGLLWLLAQQKIFYGSRCRATKQAEPASGHCISQEMGSKRRMLLQDSTGCSYKLWPVVLKLGEVWKNMRYLHWNHLPEPAAAPHYQQNLIIFSSPLTCN